MKRLALALSFVLFSSGCALLEDLFHAAFQDPKLEFENVRVRDASLSGIGLDTRWKLTNPNSVGITLSESDYQLSVEGKQIVAGKPPNGLTIPAMGSSEVLFPADFKFQQIVPTVSQLINKDYANYTVSGHVGVNTPIGVIRLPFSKSGQFEVPKVPKVALGNPKVSGLNFTGATISIPLTLTNKNSFPIPITNVTGTLYVENQAVADVSTGNLGELPGRGTKTVDLPATINFIRAGNAVVNALNGGRANVRFDAQVHSGEHIEKLAVDQALQFLK
ncbi:MAG: LEA type 2 family protein [Myxococcaceae bacterium]